MAVTKLTITAPEQLASFLDANAGSIASASWDVAGDVLTITLTSGDSLELTYTASPESVSSLDLNQFHEQVCWPKRVTKGNGVVTTETFSPLEILEAQQKIASQAATGRFRRYVVRPRETRSCG